MSVPLLVLLCMLAALLLCFALGGLLFRLCVRRPRRAPAPYNPPGLDDADSRRIRAGLDWLAAQPAEDVYIQACDGLRLHATLPRAILPAPCRFSTRSA